MLPIVPDPPSPLRATVGLLAFALALCSVVVAHGDTRAPEEAPRESSPETILSAIEQLESQKDAKCHSTASRFEDFLFGTPLSAQARLAHDEAKKRVALRLWSAASRSARRRATRRSRPDTSTAKLQRSWYRPSRTTAGSASRLAGGSVVELEGRRVEQYASIAYSLRAVLAVEQEQLPVGRRSAPAALARGESTRSWANTRSPEPGRSGARGSRCADTKRVRGTERSLVSAWALVAPMPEGAAGGDGQAARSDPSRPRDRARAVARAPRAHRRREALGLPALQRPRRGRGAQAPRLQYQSLLCPAAALALPNGSPDLRRGLPAPTGYLCRRAPAGRRRARARGGTPPDPRRGRAGRRPAPRPAADRRVRGRARLPQSARRRASHPRGLRLRLAARLRAPLALPAARRRAAPAAQRLPDPIAAEILAETISQYGVLLLRLAGEIAEQGVEAVRLHPDHLAPAAAVVADRALRHRAARPARAGPRV